MRNDLHYALFHRSVLTSSGSGLTGREGKIKLEEDDNHNQEASGPVSSIFGKSSCRQHLACAESLHVSV